MTRLSLAAILLVTAAASARAQPTLPTRDVSIVYRVEGGAHQAVPGGLPDSVRIAWNAQRQRIRVEPQGRPQILLVDLLASSVRLIDPNLQSAMAIPVRAKALDPVRLQDARLTRSGQATIAGLACTDYAVQSHQGHGTICLTSDGVALRAAGVVNGRDGSFTAISVSYGALAPNLFDVPPGYMNLTLPSGLGRFE